MPNIRQFLSGRCKGLLLLLAALCFSCGTAGAAEPVAAGESALMAQYQAIRGSLEKNQFNAPIYLESKEAEGSLRVDMFGTFNQPFNVVRGALDSPANWCEITSLHINIKACTYRKTADHWLLTLYSGRKFYQAPADAYPLKLKFRVALQQPSYLDVVLGAEEGPLRTTDHRIRLEAVPLDQSKTLVHFSYNYSQGSVARMAIKGYFNTIGRDKVGFSIIGTKGGKPVYITGVRGAVERNTVRYYLALQTFLETLKVPETQRFEQRTNRWYDLTAAYPRQLKELSKGEYLSNKKQERKNQLMLQKKAG